MSPDNTDPTAATTSDAPPSDEKPKRKRKVKTTKRKKTTKTTKAKATPAKAQAEGGDVGEAKPKKKKKKKVAKKKTTTKAKAKPESKAESNGEAPPDAARADGSAPQASAPADEPNGNRKPQPDNAPAGQADASNNANANNNGEGETKSKRRRRSRRRRKKNAANAEGQSGDNAASNGQQNQPQNESKSKKQQEQLPPEIVTGIYEQGPKSDGRIRQLKDTFLSYPTDPVVPGHLVERYDLRPGVMVECSLGKYFGGGNQGNQQRSKKKKKAKYFAIDPKARRVSEVLKVEDQDPAEYPKTPKFEDLTTIMPEPRLKLEYPGCPPACRLIDLFCPIGYGTRGMIVSPPKAGKTTLLQNIAFAIRHNHPDVEVIALLVDERPEEVTDFRRNVPCTVWASSNDHPPERHCGLAIAAIEHCKRQAEQGKDVVVLMDSLTRVGRAFNTCPGMASTGRTLSGGLDAGALAVPKQLFGAARKFEEGGTLTIIATALVDTGSRGDLVIFEEFKGTGNMELILDRKIAEQRLFPAMDLAASGTRNEDKLITNAEELETVNALRRRLLNMNPVQQIDQLLRALKRFETNDELVGNPQSPGAANRM
ncbi:MAG: transcription termination factor Rho [Phycisphaerales bacterium JB063]